MGTTFESADPAVGEKQEPAAGPDAATTWRIPTWRRFFGGLKPEPSSSVVSSEGYEEAKTRPEKWSLGVLNDRETEEVPGTWILERWPQALGGTSTSLVRDSSFTQLTLKCFGSSFHVLT